MWQFGRYANPRPLLHVRGRDELSNDMRSVRPTFSNMRRIHFMREGYSDDFDQPNGTLLSRLSMARIQCHHFRPPRISMTALIYDSNSDIKNF